MKVILLAGGFGTRLSEYTKTIPKPMIKVGGKPIIFHIMKQYAKYGFKEFYIALGYKGSVIKKFFNKNFYDWKINLIEKPVVDLDAAIEHGLTEKEYQKIIEIFSK